MSRRQSFIPALTGLFCLVILVFGGGCDFLPNLLPNDTNRIRIPSGPEAVTNEHFNRGASEVYGRADHLTRTSRVFFWVFSFSACS
jgi:hypothetical protein